MADQGVASSTNFVLNVFLARWLLPPDYGAFSVCWSIVLVLSGFHNALILEPMTIVGPAEYKSSFSAYLQSTQRLNWLVILLLALVTLGIGLAYRQPTVRSALMVTSVCLPGYLLLLVARRKQYVLNQPARALRLSLVYAVLVFGLILTCRLTGKLTAISAAAAFGMAWFAVSELRTQRSDSAPLNLREIGQAHWHYGKWLFASAILAIGVSDMQTILLSMLVDLKSAGALRALMNFVLPLSQLLTILSIYALPRLSARAKEWGKQRLLTQGIFFPAAMIVLIVLYLGALTLLAPQLEHLLYGGKLRAYLQWVPLLAASALASGVGACFSTLLRAVQNSQHQFIAGVTGSAVGAALGFYLLKSRGVPGALWSMLAANISSTLIIVATYLWMRRRRDA